MHPDPCLLPAVLRYSLHATAKNELWARRLMFLPAAKT